MAVTQEAAVSTILMIHPEHDARRQFSRLLEEGGHEVLSAATPAEAADVASRARRIDLVVSDSHLPRMADIVPTNGSRGHPFPPVLLISGFPLDPPAGMSAFLRKPFEPRELVAAVESLLARTVRS